MQIKDSSESYGAVSRGLHWGTAVLVALMLLLGWGAELGSEALEEWLMGVHVSLGIAVLALTAARVIWRFANRRRPPLPAGLEGLVARSVHWLLVALLLALPFSGWLLVSAAGFAPDFFGLFALPRLVEESEWLHELGEEVHESLPWVLVAALLLHVAGALKHHLLDGDATLRRMLRNTPD